MTAFLTTYSKMILMPKKEETFSNVHLVPSFMHLASKIDMSNVQDIFTFGLTFFFEVHYTCLRPPYACHICMRKFNLDKTYAIISKSIGNLPFLLHLHT